jgi:hypothetical protein
VLRSWQMSRPFVSFLFVVFSVWFIFFWGTKCFAKREGLQVPNQSLLSSFSRFLFCVLCVVLPHAVGPFSPKLKFRRSWLFCGIPQLWTATLHRTPGRWQCRTASVRG